jgi:hypothetical protein
VSSNSPLDGDFNADGIVDGADFLTWQRGSDPTSQDLALWQGSFGQTSGGASGQIASVPEPTSLSLAAAVACMAIVSRRRLA